MQNPDFEDGTCTALQHRILITWKKHNVQYKNKCINSHPAKQNWNNEKNCCSYHNSSKRSLSSSWFHLLTIVSSFIGTEILSQATRCVPRCENQNHCCHTDSDRIHIVRKRPTLKNHIDSYISICQTRSSRKTLEQQLTLTHTKGVHTAILYSGKKNQPDNRHKSYPNFSHKRDFHTQEQTRTWTLRTDHKPIPFNFIYQFLNVFNRNLSGLQVKTFFRNISFRSRPLKTI